MRIVIAAALIAASFGASAPAFAQSGLDGRVGRLEGEMRAVQRKVFPGGVTATVEPQITAPTVVTQGPGTPAGGAITDLTARVSALEDNVRSVTGQVEQATYRLRQFEDAFNNYKTATDARLKALENPGADAAGDTGATGAEPAGTAPPPVVATTRPTPDKQTGPTKAPPEKAPAAVAGIERPDSGDGAEDGYLYGYRLWQAKQYPAAEKALKEVADKYPKHRRASYAQNLLGRAYLDEGKPNLATLAFYDSYKKFPDGERAPDSLFYLAQALVAVKKPADACKVYDELSSVYAGKISAGMTAGVTKGRAAAKCK